MKSRKKLSPQKTYFRKYIYDPVFHSEIDLFTGPDHKWAIKQFRKRYRIPAEAEIDGDIYETTNGFCIFNRGKYMCMWFRGHVPNISTVVHECMHASLNVMERLGATRLTAEDEVLCYYIEWLVREISAVLY